MNYTNVKIISLCLALRPTPAWRSWKSLFFWVITFHRSGIEGPTNSLATVSTATRTIWSRQSHHYIRVGIPVATVAPAQLSELFDYPSSTSKSIYGYFQWAGRA